ncbi:subtilase family protein [Knoellia remsis]|uniref:Subtilase family protein n=1 Tax=Knoellia remsis TaxID=407159 RepID=A0A2T0U678_9MICO|nr:S8 family serine peptidase [Knoellia remsis]PRY53417.1 subtilase family protein [Knoellia remsis]
MRRTRMLSMAGTAAVVAAIAGSAATGAATAAPSASTAQAAGSGSYVVLTDKASDAKAVAAQLRKAGGDVTSVNTAIGLITVKGSSSLLAKARGLDGVKGAANDRSIGTAPQRAKGPDPVEKPQVFDKTRANGTFKYTPPPPEGGDPLDGLLWGHEMVNAFEARATETGDKVRVGVLDTGVDGNHQDLAPNFNRELSRNFTTDMPDIDGPCDTASCVDPADVDQNGHGTHVAGTIGAAVNDFGISGIAPDVELVNIRGGQDSGYFFVGPVTNALTYAGDVGLDVVNMSFYVDPWLYNCAGGAPEDSPEEAAEQDLIIAAMTRALNYANSKNVTLVGALGNNHEDLSNPRTDVSSPDYPGGTEHPRTIDNATCWDLPVEGPNVIGVSALGPTGEKADYSNYATDLTSGEIEVSAPGGWYRDGIGTETYRTNGNLILSTVSLASLQESAEVDKNGNITKPGRDAGVIKQCTDRRQPMKKSDCSYYAWFQGTSMASPHAAGVAALAVGAHGSGTSADTFFLAPATTRSLLMDTATDHACPASGIRSYEPEGRSAEFTARCVGTADFNSFYGDGIVNAAGVVQ